MELIKKLIASNSYKSNNIERLVSECLVKHKWNIFRSPYYVDPVTKKYRELDIKASYRFSTDKIAQSKKYHIIEYDVIFECKTMDGYHILFDSEQSGHGSRVNYYKIWPGQDSYNTYEVHRKILLNNNVKMSFIPRILDDLSKLHYPKGLSAINEYVPNPVSIKSYSSFIETNIGNEKGLDNSVLWKAFQELQSVIKAEEIENYENVESNFSGEIRYGYNHVSTDDKKIISKCKNAFKNWGGIRHLKIIHPVLVVNCDLWEVHNDNLHPIKFSRLLINDTRGYNMFWFDIVNINFIDDYSKIISDHFLTKDVINNYERL